MLVWETKKTKRIAQGRRFDHLLLCDVVKVVQGCPDMTIALDKDRRHFVTVETTERQLLLGFNLEKRSQMFADGLSLLIAEIGEKQRLRPAQHPARLTAIKPYIA